MAPKLPFQDADWAHRDFQYLEDLSTAYWYSEVLFAALELKIFAFIDQGCCDAGRLAKACVCREAKLIRLLKVLEGICLVHREKGRWLNSQVAGLYLVPGKSDYMGDFLLYRRYMRPRWQAIVEKVSLPDREKSDPLSGDDEYAARTFHYVNALDALTRQKAAEIVRLLEHETWQPPLLDVGGGAGSLARSLIRQKQEGEAVLFDLPEVILAARSIYPDERYWKRMRILEGDFRTHVFQKERPYGLVVLSNFLHAYGPKDAKSLLRKAVSLLGPEGKILIHDYFPDRLVRSPRKGLLYDLNMMLNTFQGACAESSRVMRWLREAGLGRATILDLETDSSVILAAGGPEEIAPGMDLADWSYAARDAGFSRSALLPVEKVVTAPWVRAKCRYGCGGYGKNLQCPPHGMESRDTQELLKSYTRALLLEGAPPGREFHRRLLELEKKAFLAGFHKALAFGAGPCPVCRRCPENGVCRHPDKARPSMEGSGIDVYATAANAGFNLKPVTDKGQYVKYIGLLLLE